MTLFAGITEVDITPEIAYKVAGMLNPPCVNRVVFPLFGRVFVFAENDLKIALVVLDNLMIATPLIDDIRQRLVFGTTIKPENVMICCTHTHRAPFTVPLMDEDINFEYVDWMVDLIADSLSKAIQQVQPVTLKIGVIDAPGWTFNRRQVYRCGANGEQVGTQGPQNVPEFLYNEGPEDHQLRVLLIQSSTGENLGGLVNFACHPTVMGGENVYSADYAGLLTQRFSEVYGGIFGFLQGASGNLWAIDTSKMTNDLDADYLGVDHAQQMAAGLMEKALDIVYVDSSKTEPIISIQSQKSKISQRIVSREQVELAKWYLEQKIDSIDERKFTLEMTGHDYTFYGNSSDVQEWFCREVIGLWEYQRRLAVRNPAEDVEVQVIRIGDIIIIGYPGEIFTEFGLQTKRLFPSQHILVVELANGWHGYIATHEAFTHGGYETRLGSTNRLIPDAGYIMVETASNIVKQMQENVKTK